MNLLLSSCFLGCCYFIIKAIKKYCNCFRNNTHRIYNGNDYEDFNYTEEEHANRNNTNRIYYDNDSEDFNYPEEEQHSNRNNTNRTYYPEEKHPKSILEKDIENNKDEKINSKKSDSIKTKLKQSDILITIIFNSNDQGIKDYKMLCKTTEIFAIIEQDLYKKYPNYKETENYFLLGGYKINKNKTLEENKIKDNDIIVLDTIEDENNELITIIFNSEDQGIKDYKMLCKKTEIFAIIEQDLYKKYPNYKETENYFLLGGYKINKNKTLEENKIKDNDIIVLVEIND